MSNRGSEGDILRALALEDAVRRQMDQIVRRAAETVTLLKPKGKKRSDLQENQIRNVMNVAEESKSVEVVTNFIRYQIGRSSRGQRWQYNGFGLQVIKDIEAGVVAEAADEAAATAAEKIGVRADKAALHHQAHLELTCHYLGYLNRAFIFCTKTEETGHKDYPDPWAVVVRLEEACQHV